MKRRSLLKFFFFAIALGLVAGLRAEDLKAVQARMGQRLAQIDAAKSSGALGENNRGLVEVRGGGGDVGTLASEENKDREIVYAALAQQTKTTAEEVGKSRAQKIAQNSKPGVWIQDAGGDWRKK